MDTKKFLDNMQQHLIELQDKGDLTMGILHDDNTPFIIVEGWQGVYKLNTYLALEAGIYNLYREAIANATDYDKHGKALFTLIPGPAPILFPDVYLDNKKEYDLIDDLRLGRNRRYPDSQYSTPFLVPEPLDELMQAFEEKFGEFGFSDEYDFCGACGKIIKTSPDSYSWQPDFILTDDGYIHVDCINLDDVLESHKNHEKALPPQLQQRAIDQGLLIEISDITFENGLHPGMNDDPKIIIRTFKRARIDVWFNVQPSQFYVEFTVLVQPDNESAAREILSHLDTYQGYDNAEEIQKALKGQPSDYYHVETRQIDPQNFIDGKL